MDMLMFLIMAMLLACIVGVAVLLISVTVYILKAIEKEKRKLKVRRCLWLRSSEMDDYTSGCRHSYYDASESGNPITDALTYCPYCGGVIDELK